LPMARAGSNSAQVSAGPPLWLLAELTYRCPLHCVFCYNPTDYAHRKDELSTAQWLDVIREARSLGAVQLGFSGGEPLMRDDLEELVREAHRLGYYTNLITSGVGLNERRVGALREAGLDHIQLSFQDSEKQLNDFLSSTRTFELKLRVAGMIKAHGYPMVMNCVLHRHNLPHVDKIIDMALELGAEYLELANTQYYGWAFLNRAHLLPTKQEVEAAEAVVERYRQRIGNRMRIFFVVPDYYADRPKACMNGWGAVFLCVAPDGTALPCHAARQLPLSYPNVTGTSLREIWYESDAFNRFRGNSWMREPCRSCPEQAKDFGGCRCQAYLFTGEAENCDPVCSKSPNRDLVEAAIVEAQGQRETRVHPVVFTRSLAFRTDANSLALSPGPGQPTA